jgi:hypothetical protein
MRDVSVVCNLSRKDMEDVLEDTRFVRDVPKVEVMNLLPHTFSDKRSTVLISIDAAF